MGNLLGGGGGSGGGGLLGGGGSGGGGFLGGLLGGLPDPLGIGKMLGITGGEEPAQAAPAGPMGPPQPSGVKFAGSPSSGVSFDPRSMGNSPMGPTGFGVGGGNQGQR